MKKIQSNPEFEKALAQLNGPQKEAVATIEGPVLVVAGPGTGKTQILALRVGNILMQKDAQPENILCLTYTEAGTIAMRRRLLSFIGPDAYRVPIHTFHGFCNSVIQENMAYFSRYRDLRQADELEVRMLIREILDGLPMDHLLRRLKGEVYWDVKNLLDLFSDMKKEDWSSEQVVAWVQQELEDAKSDPKYIYKRRTGDKMPGDLKEKDYGKYAEKLQKTAAAAGLFDEFNRRMTEHGWYDYNDMILWVLRAFQADPELLADYQERYQYFLVDEYQDTNGSQNELVDLLAAFWERPNLFVVGDDDQAIYRFQGANIGNITHYIKKYDPARIVLRDNYRSSQVILDAARTLIDHNEERLVKTDPGLTKELIASHPDVRDLGRKPLVVEYQNAHEESAGILEWIEKFRTSGVPLKEIAVLFRNHKQVEELVRVMEQRGIPMNLKKKVDILELPLVHQVLSLLEFLDKEYREPFSADHILFEILHYPYFHVPALDIARLSFFIKMENRRRRDEETANKLPRISLREAISDEELIRKAHVQDPGPLLNFHKNIDRWIREQHEFTIQVLFEKILRFGNVYQYIFSQDDRFWLLQVIKTFFDFIKEQTAKRPHLSLADFLEIVQNMREEKLPIPFHRVIQAEDGINFITAHSSKGLEFDVVIMMGCTQKIWDGNKPNKGYTYTPQMAGGSTDATKEDERRLFFVGMTRAKKDLLLTYHLRTADDKETDQCQFLAEVRSNENLAVKHEVQTPVDLVEAYLESLIYRKEREVPLLDHGMIERALEGYTMSVTALNKYLECKLSFYFENILSVPSARNANMGFGSAIHRTLQDTFRKGDQKIFPGKEEIYGIFERAMDHYRSHFTGREYDDRLELGRQVLDRYYDEYRSSWDLPMKYHLEKKIDHVHHAGIPINGILDKIEEYKNHYVVVDYKTGDPKNSRDHLKGPDEKNEMMGGKYWRQIVFYQLLMDADARFTKSMDKGIMDFVQPNSQNDRMEKHSIVVGPEDRELVTRQLVESYEGVMRHEFLPGCGDEKCHWCQFVLHSEYGSVLPERSQEDQ